MPPKPFPSPDTLRRLLRYDAETGRLFWLSRPEGMFPAKRAHSVWNARFAGKEALTAITNGYRVGNIEYKLCQAHRVIWAIVHGYWPAGDIDHANGDRGDNRLANLREATRSENMCNRGLSSRNSSGATGVFLHQATQKWRAHIKKDGRARHLGCFDTFDEALAARRSAESMLHGEFARAA